MFQPPFQILVDKKPVELLQPCPTITSLIVNHDMRVQIPVDSSYRKPISEWLYNLAQRATTVSYNGSIIEKESVRKLI